jgi:hypothetical protein
VLAGGEGSGASVGAKAAVGYMTAWNISGVGSMLAYESLFSTAILVWRYSGGESE